MENKKLIDAEDFLDLFYVASAGQDKTFVKVVEMVVEDTPAIDAVEVVRCKDCMYRDIPKCCPCQIGGYRVTDDWYCPMGVKMERGDSID